MSEKIIATKSLPDSPPLVEQSEPPKHVFHGFTELPVGYKERALEAKLARAAITAPAEVHDPATDGSVAELDILPDDRAKADKLNADKKGK
jgi:hypothetical protein